MQPHEALIKLIESNRPWIMERVLKYADEIGYMPYIPKEPALWLAALEKINQTFAHAVHSGVIAPMQAVHVHGGNPIRNFAIEEAQNHRRHGVDFPIFLVVLKYIEESYLDLIRHKGGEIEQMIECLDALRLFFDFLAIEFSVAWADILSNEASEEHRQATKQLEEKNSLLSQEHAAQQELIDKLEAFQGQLLQSEKMASIGLLAAGIAHEINNPVAYVFSNLGTLEKYLTDMFMLFEMYEAAEPHMQCLGDKLTKVVEFKQQIELDFLKQDIRALLAESREGLQRVKKIVLDLKDFSHAGIEEKWVLADLHTGLDSTLNVIWNELKYKCEVKKEYADLPMIICFPQQLNQVFMNLLTNAAQAIEMRGTITIRTGHDGDYVWVEIEDTGKGIPPECLGKIFEPFFTTKPVGKGTGLGLSVSYSIVEKHHGRFDVHSEVGRGTKFRVTLPVSQLENQ